MSIFRSVAIRYTALFAFLWLFIFLVWGMATGWDTRTLNPNRYHTVPHDTKR